MDYRDVSAILSDGVVPEVCHTQGRAGRQFSPYVDRIFAGVKLGERIDVQLNGGPEFDGIHPAVVGFFLGRKLELDSVGILPERGMEIRRRPLALFGNLELGAYGNDNLFFPDCFPGAFPDCPPGFSIVCGKMETNPVVGAFAIQIQSDFRVGNYIWRSEMPGSLCRLLWFERMQPAVGDVFRLFGQPVFPPWSANIRGIGPEAVSIGKGIIRTPFAREARFFPFCLFSQDCPGMAFPGSPKGVPAFLLS